MALQYHFVWLNNSGMTAHKCELTATSVRLCRRNGDKTQLKMSKLIWKVINEQTFCVNIFVYTKSTAHRIYLLHLTFASVSRTGMLCTQHQLVRVLQNCLHKNISIKGHQHMLRSRNTDLLRLCPSQFCCRLQFLPGRLVEIHSLRYCFVCTAFSGRGSDRVGERGSE